MNEILKLINDIRQEHPYKIPGQHDTYDHYNEGWQDACIRIEAVISAVLEGRYEQICSINNAACLGYKDGKCHSIENCYGKQERPVIKQN